MKKIKICLFSLIFIGIIFYSNKIFAASAYLVSSSNSVNVGDEFSISINLSDISAATLTARISVDTSKVQYVSGPSNANFSNGRVIYSWTDSTGGQSPLTGGTIATFRFKAVSTGSANFGISGEFFSSEEEMISVNYSGVGVNIVEPAPPAAEQTESPYVEEPPIVNNTPSIQESDGQTQNNNTSQGQKSSNANLRSLQLDVVGISPAFNKNTTSYWITVPTSINSIGVTAVPEDSNATVTVLGNENLQNGRNYINIRVTAENGTTVKTYTINVTRSDDEEASNANLESLAIEGVTLVPEFNEDVTEYTIDLKEDLKQLNILAFPRNESATVRIEGNENLAEGENTIRIIVTSENGESEKIYTIKVNKNLEQKDRISTEENINNLANEQGNNSIMNIILFIVIAIIIIAIVIFIAKKYKERR